MKNKSTLNNNRHMHELFQARNNQFSEMINSLKITDVKEEKVLKDTKERIKSQILLTPVLFELPKIVDDRTENRQMGPNYLNPLGGQQQVKIVTVEFPFTGSNELFGVSPDSVSFSDPTIYLPIGNSVPVEIVVEKLDKEEVLQKANKAMSLTKELIKDINPQIEGWSKRMENQIDEHLQAKRQELLDLYS